MMATLGVRVTLVEGRQRGAGVSRQRDHRGVSIPDAPRGHDASARGKGREDRATCPRTTAAARSCRRHSNQANICGRRRCFMRLAGRGRPMRCILEAAGLKADDRERLKVKQLLPDGSAAHLCGRRRGRISGAGQHRDGAGAAGGLSCLWRRHEQHAGTVPAGHLRAPGDQHGGQNRRSSSPTPAFLTRRASLNTRRSPAGNCWATTPGCSSC